MMRNPHAVIREGFVQVDCRNNESTGRYYHCLYHSQMVLKYVRRFAILSGVSIRRLKLLEIAAAWHDVELSLGPVLNEIESGKLAAKSMSNHGYGVVEQEIVKELIFGTITVWEDGYMHQSAEVMGDYEKMIADADLCSLGAGLDNYVFMSQLYMAEEAGKKFASFSPEEIESGWAKQYKFITSRKFLTDVAHRLYHKHWLLNMEEARNMAGL